jgi:hypothetical protein
MWGLAVEEKLLPGRNSVSMRKHYRKLDAKINRTVPVVAGRAPNFTAEEDYMLFRWLYQWQQQRGLDGMWGERMWDIAEKEQLLPGRTGEQMFNRFHNSIRKRLAEGLAAAAEDTTEFLFTIPLNPKSTPIKAIVPKPSQDAAAASPVVQQNVVVGRPDEVKFASEMIQRIQLAVQNKPMSEIIRALYFTCCDERAAISVLCEEELDSKYDLWTAEEDRRLREGEELDRPDVLRRRVFLGLDPRKGL